MKIARALFCIANSPLARISHDAFLPLDPIPEIPAWIPDRLVGLRVAFFIGRAHDDGIAPWRLSSPRRFPGAERVGAMVLAELRVRPVLSVIRNFHSVYYPEATESDPA